MSPLRIDLGNPNWDSRVETALEMHLVSVREHHDRVWPHIVVGDAHDFFETAPVLPTPPSANAGEIEWSRFNDACEEAFLEWEAERFRRDDEIPYFHLTSMFVDVCSATQSWLS